MWTSKTKPLLWLKLFRAHSGYSRHETFSLMMSLPAMSFGDQFCFSRKGGRWVDSIAASGLVSRNDLVGTGKVISILFGVRNKWFHIVGPPFQCSRPIFQLQQVGIFRDLTRHLLIGGCGQSQSKGWLQLPQGQFWPLQLNRTDSGICLRVLESEMTLRRKFRP